jgi:hypothetical protein
MPFVIRRSRGPLWMLAAVGAAMLVAAPAAAAKGAAANAEGCTAQPASLQPFTAWGDSNFYTLVSGGDMESSAGWTFNNGAKIVSGNAPFKVGATQGTKSLSLPSGSSVVTAPICIDSTYPFFRMFARKTGSGFRAALKVETVYTDNKGRLVAKSASSYAGTAGAWALSAPFSIRVKFESQTAAAPVQFRLTAQGGSSWQLDDIYVDPRMRG